MAEIKDKDSICRICMQSVEGLIPISSEVIHDHQTITIAKIITECTKYPVATNDELPEQICSICMTAAQTAHQFKKQTEEAYCQLKALYAKNWFPKVQEKNVATTEGNASSVSTLMSDKFKDECTQTDEITIHMCDLCPKKFYIERELKQHVAKAHLNECKQCRFCGDMFTQLGRLKVHLATTHPNEGIHCEFKCNICSKPFSRKHHLKRHFTKVHNLTNEQFNIFYNFNDHQEGDTDDGVDFHEAMFKAALDTNSFSNENETKQPDNTKADIKQFEETITQPETLLVDKPDNTDTTGINDYANLINLEPENTTGIGKEFEQTYVNNLSCERHSSSHSKENDDNIENGNELADEDNTKSESNMEDLVIDPLKYLETNVETDSNPITTVNEDIENEFPKPPTLPCDSAKIVKNHCKECNHTFTRHNLLVRHMLTHSNIKPYTCSFCGKAFSRTDSLQIHIQNVHGERKYKCQQCSSAYGRKDNLQRHILTRHNRDPTVQRPQFNCDMCEKKFVSKAYLAKHKLLHADRLYACKHCSETFTEKDQMNEHEKQNHTQPRSFLCNICGVSLKKNAYLKTHMRRHTGEKPYKCQFCEKAFPRKTDLKMHERYHKGLKPHLCNLCGKGFHRSNKLTVHMRTHTGEKPYKCNQCPKAFAQSNDLKAHIRCHTGEHFECDLCDAAFSQRRGLNAHKKEVHNIIVSSFTGRLRKIEQQAEGIEVNEQPTKSCRSEYQQ